MILSDPRCGHEMTGQTLRMGPEDFKDFYSSLGMRLALAVGCLSSQYNVYANFK